eukprot:GHVT01068905.1.p1 GENE.GHVT01068905.1~~GHVT01068905.1.p1  ORF type:complete len:765 (+),score=75.91 GHVT01068905.1:5499-7793(+)
MLCLSTPVLIYCVIICVLNLPDAANDPKAIDVHSIHMTLFLFAPLPKCEQLLFGVRFHMFPYSQLWRHQQEHNIRYLKPTICNRSDIAQGNDSILIPPLPPKRSFGLLEPKFVDKRRRGLEQYLRTVLALPHPFGLCRPMCDFLGIPPRVVRGLASNWNTVSHTFCDTADMDPSRLHLQTYEPQINSSQRNCAISNSVPNEMAEVSFSGAADRNVLTSPISDMWELTGASFESHSRSASQVDFAASTPPRKDGACVFHGDDSLWNLSQRYANDNSSRLGPRRRLESAADSSLADPKQPSSFPLTLRDKKTPVVVPLAPVAIDTPTSGVSPNTAAISSEVPSFSGDYRRRRHCGIFLDDSARVCCLVTNLVEFPSNKVETLLEFDSWVTVVRPQLTEDLIVKLLIGQSNNGLLFEIGSTVESPLSSAVALKLLRRLMDLEHCAVAKTVVRILRGLDCVVYLKALNLHHHLRLDHTSVREDVFFVLDTLSQTMGSEEIAEVLAHDAEAIEEFERWWSWQQQHRHSRHLVLLESVKAPPPAVAVKQPGVNTGSSRRPEQYKQQAKSAFTTLETCLSTLFVGSQVTRASTSALVALTSPPTGWMEQHVVTGNASEPLLPPQHQLHSLEAVQEQFPSGVVSPSDCWHPIFVPPTFQAYQIVAGYQELPSADAYKPSPRLYLLRGNMRLPLSAEHVATGIADYPWLVEVALRNPDLDATRREALHRLRREHWNPKVRAMETLEIVSAGLEVLDVALEAACGPPILVRYVC